MKPTATATPAPPERSTPKSGATKRPRKAAALSDVTNLLLPETPTPINPRRSERRSIPQRSDASSTCSSSASVTPAHKRSASASATPTLTPKRSSAASVTPAPKLFSAAGLEEEGTVIKSPAISTVYLRRGAAQAEGRWRKGNPTTDKGKGKGKGKEPVSAAAGTASCPQLGKSTRDNNRKSSMAQQTRPISSSAPCHEAKRKRPSPRTPKLPEDFVKEKRDYFAAVDAYELQEEEVSETDLD